MQAEAQRLFDANQQAAKLFAAAWSKRLHHAVDAEELLSPILEGIWTAAERFDPACGVKFMSFAQRHMHGRMMDYLRETDHLSRLMRERVNRGEVQAPTLLRLQYGRWREGDDGVGVDELSYGDARPGAELELHETVERAFQVLSPISREMVRMVYLEGKSMLATGAALGLSESAVSLRLIDARQVLREHLTNRHPEMAGVI